MKKSVISALLLILFNVSQAATYCVTNANELRLALADAEATNQSDIIKMQIGDYYTEGTEFSFDDESGYGLDISGGWTFLSGAGNCGAQLSTNVLDTVIDGSGLSAGLSISLDGAADVRVAKLTFANAISNDAALSIRKYNTNGVYQGHYMIEQNFFINNETGAGSASAVYVRGADKIEFRNNLVYKNLGSGSSVKLSNPLGVEVYFTNNTIYKNEGYVSIDLEGSSEMLMANNFIQRQVGLDLYVSGGIWHMYNNNVFGYHSTPTTAVNNINLPPRFIDELSLDFRPDIDSPLIDKGFLPCLYTPHFCIFPMPFTHDWELTTTDLFSADRIQNNKVEIGAFEVDYESDVIFMNLFD